MTMQKTFVSCIYGGELKCIIVKTYKNKVVIQDRHNKDNKMELSKIDWNSLVSSIQSGKLNKI